jgi:hypothetical protein
MKTTIISAMVLTLALTATAALAQDDKNAAGAEWFNCSMNFQKMYDEYIATLEAIIQATKNGSLKADSKVVCAAAKDDAFMEGAGEACLDLGKRVPQNAPGKKFVTKMDKKILVTVKIFQKHYARDRKICEKLQKEEEDAQRDKDSQNEYMVH